MLDYIIFILCIVIHLVMCCCLKSNYISKLKWFFLTEYLTLIYLIIYENFSDSSISQELYESLVMLLIFLIIDTILIYFRIRKLKSIFNATEKSPYRVLTMGEWSSLSGKEIDYISNWVNSITSKYIKKNWLFLGADKKFIRFVLVFFSREDYELFKSLRGSNEDYTNEEVTIKKNKVAVSWDIIR